MKQLPTVLEESPVTSEKRRSLRWVLGWHILRFNAARQSAQVLKGFSFKRNCGGKSHGRDKSIVDLDSYNSTAISGDDP